MVDLLTQKRLQELLIFNQDNGCFYWRKSPKNQIKAGSLAGKIEKGYVRIKIDGNLYRGHRLAWLYVYGEFPDEQVDHINGVRNDNRIENLRKCNNAQNQQNRTIKNNNKCNATGVDFMKGLFRARITVDKKSVLLGLFKDVEKAKYAYLEAKQKHHAFYNSENK
jgi:hypothetical protein